MTGVAWSNLDVMTPDQLRAMLTISSDPVTLTYAAELFGRKSDVAGALKVLPPHMDHPHVAVREGVAYGLAAHVSDPWVRALLAQWLLREESQGVRYAIREALEEAGDRREEIEALSPELRRDLELLCVLASNPENERGITESRAREILGCGIPEFRALVRRWERE